MGKQKCLLHFVITLFMFFLSFSFSHAAAHWPVGGSTRFYDFKVGTNIIRLHIDGVVVGEKSVAYASQKGVTEDTIRPLNLLGIDSSSNGVQGYAHYVRLLAQPAVTNHYVKNPPLELALDGSSGAPDDHEVEESGDGIWSVVGGKDKEFLRRIAGCSETVVREAFDRLWQWLFPVALALSNPQIQTAWESIDPKWIEGMISREEVEVLLRTSEKFPKPGTFILRFPISRSWPHPDAGALIVSYVGPDYGIHHRLLSLDESSGGSEGMEAKQPLEELLLSQPELSQVCRIPCTQPDT